MMLRTVTLVAACGPACEQSTPTPTDPALESHGRIADDFVAGSMEFSPANATINSYHAARAPNGSAVGLDVLLDD